MIPDRDPAKAVPVRAWHATLPPPLMRQAAEDCGLGVVRYRGIDGRIDQPGLREHVLAVHLGGAKRVTRLHGRHRESHAVEDGAITIMPAAEPCRWNTVGPVDFAHIVFAPETLARVALEEHDRDPDALQLRGTVGVRDELVGQLTHALLAEVARPGARRIYRDSLLTALACNLVARYSNIDELGGRRSVRAGPGGRGGLAPWQLRRVLEFLHTHLAEDVALADLVALTGLSRGHFFRAFGRATGRTPVAYLTDLRIEAAQALLGETTLAVTEVAAAVGIGAASFPAAFRKRTGVTPGAFRRLRSAFAGDRT